MCSQPQKETENMQLPTDCLFGRVSLSNAHPLLRVEYLSVQVVDLHSIIVQQA